MYWGNNSGKKKKNNKKVLNRQISIGLNKIKKKQYYYSLWTCLVYWHRFDSTPNELFETVAFIKKKIKNHRVLYGGSVSPKNILKLRSIDNIDGFLIGGASQNSKNLLI